MSDKISDATLQEWLASENSKVEEHIDPDGEPYYILRSDTGSGLHLESENLSDALYEAWMLVREDDDPRH